MGSTRRCRSTRSAGPSSGAGNTIAYNHLAGVGVIDNFNGPTTGIEILSNSIYANQGLGIDLGGDGVTSEPSGRTDPRPQQPTRTSRC